MANNFFSRFIVKIFATADFLHFIVLKFKLKTLRCYFQVRFRYGQADSYLLTDDYKENKTCNISFLFGINVKRNCPKLQLQKLKRKRTKFQLFQRLRFTTISQKIFYTLRL